jgi:RNA polymerase primary sigma factor
MFARYHQGDNEAKEIILQSHIWDLESIAKEYLHKGMNLPELIQEGKIGLNKAVEKFDATRGFRFLSYAQWWIRQSMLQAIQKRKQEKTSAYVAAFLITA